MSSEHSSKKASRPQLVKLEKAFKLAEKWVDSMSKSSCDEPVEVELEARPQRLGIGATVPRQSSSATSNNPVERKLRAKLNVERRRLAKDGYSTPSTINESLDEDNTDDELESRTKAFTKKRPVDLTSSSHQKKKK